LYKNISERIVKFLIKSDAIETEKSEIYEFGIESILSRIFSLILLFFVAFLLTADIEACVFYVSFLLMRKFSGGYHASSYLSCTILYILTFISVVLLSRFIFPVLFTIPTLILALCLSVFTIYIYAPIENPNNPIVDNKRTDYRKSAIIIVLLLSVVDILLFSIRLNISYTLLASMMFAVTYMYIEIIKRKFKGGEIK
jgi:accessory gene regulator B